MAHENNAAERDTAKKVSGLLRHWFGDPVGIAVELIGTAYPLFPVEERYIGQAVLCRRQEFSAGRWCARQALAELGFSPVAIGVGSLREPLWPSGIVGSITHDSGIAAAVAAHSERWQGVGIDILGVEAAKESLREAAALISSEEEEREARLVLGGRVEERSLLFSAKESATKSISSTIQRLVDFGEISMRLHSDSFDASCREVPGMVKGRWDVIDGLIVTCAALE